MGTSKGVCMCVYVCVYYIRIYTKNFQPLIQHTSSIIRIYIYTPRAESRVGKSLGVSSFGKTSPHCDVVQALLEPIYNVCAAGAHNGKSIAKCSELSLSIYIYTNKRSCMRSRLATLSIGVIDPTGSLRGLM